LIQIAFLGSDSTHVEAFAKRINPPGSSFHQKSRVVSLWGEDSAQASAKAAALGIPRAARSLSDALKGADLAFVLGRFGDSHRAPALAAIERGLPTFVDKPFTLSLQEAEELARRAAQKKVPLMSSSPLRFAKELSAFKEKTRGQAIRSLVVSAPANCIDLPGRDPRFDSPFFYGIHGIEMLLQAAGGIGRGFKAIAGASAASVVVDFGAFSGVLNLLRGTKEFYAFEGYAGTERHEFTIDLDGSCYDAELAFLLETFAEGKGTIPMDGTLQAIAILEDVRNRIKEVR